MSTRNPEFAPPIDTEILDSRAYEEARAEHLRQRFGNEFVWDKEFGVPDDRDSQARIASAKLKAAIAAAGVDEDRPLRFSVRIANRSVPIQVVEQEGRWFCNMPVQTSAGVYEWRRVEADDYDNLIATINRLCTAGPTIRDLTPEQELELARACATKNKATLAAVLEAYLRLRLGPGADESSLNDPRYRSTVDEACLFVFAHSEPDFPNTPAAAAFIKKYAAGRPLTIPLCKAAMKVYEEKAAEHAEQLAAAPPQITEAELQAAPDEDVNQTFAGVRRAYAEAERNRRDLLHNTSRLTPEQAIEALRGPEE